MDEKKKKSQQEDEEKHSFTLLLCLFPFISFRFELQFGITTTNGHCMFCSNNIIYDYQRPNYIYVVPSSSAFINDICVRMCICGVCRFSSQMHTVTLKSDQSKATSLRVFNSFPFCWFSQRIRCC